MKRASKAICGWGLAVGVSLLVMEVGARILTTVLPNHELTTIVAQYSAFPTREAAFRFQPDDDFGYRLTPNYVRKGVSGDATNHNAMGFRSSTEFGPKAPNALRIICLGGSTTYGTGVEDDTETYPSQLAEILGNAVDLERYSSVEVLNLGVGNYTSVEVLKNLERYGLALDPDIVLIQSAINDIAPRFYSDFECEYTHFRIPMKRPKTGPIRRLWRSSRLVLTLGWRLGIYKPLTLQSWTQRPMPVMDAALENLAINGSECFEENIREAVRLCIASGAKMYLLTQPYMDSPSQPEADASARRLEETYKLGLLDHNAVVSKIALLTEAHLIDVAYKMPKSLSFFADPIHMTPVGNRVKAEIIADVLTPQL